MDGYGEHIETDKTPLHHPRVEFSRIAAMDFVQEADPLVRGRKEGACATSEVSDAGFTEAVASLQFSPAIGLPRGIARPASSAAPEGEV